MSKPLSERELLESQIKIYEFYAGLIDRAVRTGGSAGAKLPKWDEQRAEEYKRLADELRTRLAELDAREANAPATVPGVTSATSSPTSGSDVDSTASPE
jgi:hypothetical protein